MKSPIKAFLELTTSECKCQVYEGRGVGIIHPSSLPPPPPPPVLVISSYLYEEKKWL